MIKIKYFTRKFWVFFYFATIISVHSTLFEKREGPEPNSDPDLYSWLTGPDADPWGQKIYGSYESGSGTLLLYNFSWSTVCIFLKWIGIPKLIFYI
jgi:hypothetical protein